VVEGDPTEPLIGRVVTALRWSFIATVVVRFSSLGVSVVLARLLGPPEFGVYAVALVALTAVLSLNELGVSVALVRYQGDEKEIAPTVATLSLIGSVICYGVVFASAPYLSSAFGAPAAVGPIRLMGLAVLIDGVVAVPAALLQRHFMQGRRAIADISNFGVGSVISIILAFTGMGAMSLAVGRIAGSLVSAVQLVALSPLPLRFGWDRRQVRHLLDVGLPLAGASLIVFGILNLDSFVVGHAGGAVVLGIYVLAFNLSSWPVTVLSQPIRKVTVPAFSRLLDDPARLGRAVVDSFGGLLSVTLPVAACLGASAYPLVRVVYGDQWISSAPILIWLAALGASRVVLELLYDLLVALGDTRRLFLLQITWLVLLGVGLPVGQHFGGVVGVAVAHCLIATALIIPMHAAVIGRRLNLPVLALLTVTIKPLISAAVIVAVAIAAQRFAPDLIALALTGLVAGLLGLHALLTLRTRARAMINAEPVRTVSA
jgi:O-antigen/teichoic acid export membrane protein